MTNTTARYEVTASKYRPKTFDELAGQEFVVSTIKNSLVNGRIAHAYLFSGPRGCGKTSAARILARSLNCEAMQKQGAAEPCGVCDNCRSISQGSNMDVLEIDGASNNGVESVRQIKDEVLFPPQSGRYKVYIIDEVHMLTTNAFNALLKTIEEPPPYICFIFATTELHKVPPTIKSRCQQFNFRLIPIDTIQGILKKICSENEIQAEDDALFLIARESTGSMRDALTLFDQVVSFSAGNIRSGLIREKLGLIGLEKINALAEACAANDTQNVFTLTGEIIDSGIDFERFVIDLAGYYRSLLLLKNGITRESILGYPSSQFSVKALGAYDSIRLEQALDILLNCYRDLRYSVSPRFEIETAVSKLSWLNKWVSPAELKQSLDGARAALLQGGASVMAHNAAPAEQTLAGQSLPAGHNVAHNVSPPADNSANDGGSSSGERSLKDAFQRVVAARDERSEDEDVPLWDSAVNKNKDTEDYSQVEQVREVIPGEIVP